MEEVVFPTCHRCGQACPEGHSWGWGWGGQAAVLLRQWTEASETIWRLLGQEPQEEGTHRSLCPFQPHPSSSFSSLGLSHANPTPRLPPAPPASATWSLAPPGAQASFQAPGPVSPPCLCLGPISVCGEVTSLSVSVSLSSGVRGWLWLPLWLRTQLKLSHCHEAAFCVHPLTGHSESLRARAQCSHSLPCRPGSCPQGLDE